MKMSRALLVLICLAAPALAQATRPATAPAQRDLDQQFQHMLTGATLVGHFTMGEQAAPKEERYTITSLSRIPFTENWMIMARIQYGGKDVTVPIVVPVKWAGDTPMISLTDAKIPGLGTYTARVLFYRDQYAGTWSGGGHGGTLFGRIEREKSTPAPPKP